MDTIRAVGLVVYAYGVLEERLEALWDWFGEVEAWVGQPFAEYYFTPRGKQSLRIWKATRQNRERLLERLRVEQPWFVLDLGWPAGTLKARAYQTEGADVALKSREQPWKGGADYCWPSYLSLIAHRSLLEREGSVDGLLQLAMSAWRAIDGVYGFIDIETGVPPQADLIHTFDHLLSNLITPEYDQEFTAWQLLRSYLDRRVWKAFWGNLLGAEHLIRLGGIEELRRSDAPYRRRLPEFEQQAYREGTRILQESSGYHRWLDLDNQGVLLTLSESPLTWYDHDEQQRRQALDKALTKIALRTDE